MVGRLTGQAVRRVEDPRILTGRGRYVDEHVSTTFINDAVGVRLRHEIGVDRMLWSSDYPHISANWPNSRTVLLATFSGVPPAEADQILAGNAVRLYGF